ncbi:MAG TPA: hypothetical protein VHT97_09835 [Acidimicrobiales bacterium]|nr:hypothetical protein [Acidimicrobiales bacterium]
MRPSVAKRPAKRRRWPLVVLVCLLAVGAVGVGLRVAASYVASGPAKPSPSCTVVMSTGRLRLDLAQAANAATIAAVGKRMGLVDHAVTVALVAALQESKLHNLDSGDLDSVGLFQQRPSQGWGSPSELIVPTFAAEAFYKALMRVPGWETMAVGDAAQRVQRSAAPDAYGPWENQGRSLAQALTGETAAGLTCRFDLPSPAATPVSATSLNDAVAGELGSPALGVAVPEQRGWTVAAWLVAHAFDQRITAVTYLGQRWTPATGVWQPQGPAVDQVQITRG